MECPCCSRSTKKKEQWERDVTWYLRNCKANGGPISAAFSPLAWSAEPSCTPWQAAGAAVLFTLKFSGVVKSDSGSAWARIPGGSYVLAPAAQYFPEPERSYLAAASIKIINPHPRYLQSQCCGESVTRRGVWEKGPRLIFGETSASCMFLGMRYSHLCMKTGKEVISRGNDVICTATNTALTTEKGSNFTETLRKANWSRKMPFAKFSEMISDNYDVQHEFYLKQNDSIKFITNHDDQIQPNKNKKQDYFLSCPGNESGVPSTELEQLGIESGPCADVSKVLKPGEDEVGETA